MKERGILTCGDCPWYHTAHCRETFPDRKECPTRKAFRVVRDHCRDLQAELSRVNDQVLRISQVYNAWGNGDEPEGAPSKSRTLQAIGEILGKPF